VVGVVGTTFSVEAFGPIAALIFNAFLASGVASKICGFQKDRRPGEPPCAPPSVVAAPHRESAGRASCGDSSRRQVRTPITFSWMHRLGERATPWQRRLPLLADQKPTAGPRRRRSKSRRSCSRPSMRRRLFLRGSRCRRASSPGGPKACCTARRTYACQSRSPWGLSVRAPSRIALAICSREWPVTAIRIATSASRREASIRRARGRSRRISSMCRR